MVQIRKSPGGSPGADARFAESATFHVSPPQGRLPEVITMLGMA